MYGNDTTLNEKRHSILWLLAPQQGRCSGYLLFAIFIFMFASIGTLLTQQQDTPSPCWLTHGGFHSKRPLPMSCSRRASLYPRGYHASAGIAFILNASPCQYQNLQRSQNAHFCCFSRSGTSKAVETAGTGGTKRGRAEGTEGGAGREPKRASAHPAGTGAAEEEEADSSPRSAAARAAAKSRACLASYSS